MEYAYYEMQLCKPDRVPPFEVNPIKRNEIAIFSERSGEGLAAALLQPSISC
jgi:hypothetical protein